jgi:hypothetical protein
LKQPAAALTMVKDDYFFLEKWIAYYGGLFGRDALYIISHGGDPEIDRIAQGCSVIRIPGGIDPGFDAKRWRMLSHYTNGLLNYYNFVICGDVDEFVIMDPKTKLNLAQFLLKRKPSIITPIGLEVVHRLDTEKESIEEGILKTRHFCRYSSYFSTPCVVGKPVKFARGGHYSTEPELKLFRNLYLFHMKYADFDQYKGRLLNRSQAMAALNLENDSSHSISAHWFANEQGFGAEIEKLSALPEVAEFNLREEIKWMDSTWEQRNEHGLWHFRKRVGEHLFPIPERFAGIV